MVLQQYKKKWKLENKCNVNKRYNIWDTESQAGSGAVLRQQVAIWDLPQVLSSLSLACYEITTEISHVSLQVTPHSPSVGNGNSIQQYFINTDKSYYFQPKWINSRLHEIEKGFLTGNIVPTHIDFVSCGIIYYNTLLR